MTRCNTQDIQEKDAQLHVAVAVPEEARRPARGAQPRGICRALRVGVRLRVAVRDRGRMASGRLRGGPRLRVSYLYEARSREILTRRIPAAQ
jgi:hypothetical protein